MSRILSKELDEAADRIVDRIIPVMRDSIARAHGLKFTYSLGQWEAIFAAVTEKLPSRIKEFPLSKEERVELLGAIDMLDRGAQQKGRKETLEMIMRSLIGMRDMSSGLVRFLKMRVMDEDGNDITEEVFD
jgi:hypothetical protein